MNEQEPVETAFGSARWIRRKGLCLNNRRNPVLPAPLLRTEFDLPSTPVAAQVQVCGIGYFTLHVNGALADDQVLVPTVSQYDDRVRYLTIDLVDQLRAGRNAIGVVLGNGWYNCHTPVVWHFDSASWRDYPKLILALHATMADGSTVTHTSDAGWRAADGPIRFDSLRNGETYDAREEQEGWDTPGFDDRDWAAAEVVPGPGGRLQPQLAPGCRVTQTLTPVSVREIRSGVAIFDMGQNMAGWAQLRVCGPAGTEVTLRYSEKLGADGDIDTSNIEAHIDDDRVQTDVYILKGDGEEIWEPRFTYHGFQYVQVSGLPGAPTLDQLRGRVVHTAFASAGTLDTSNEDLNRLQACTRWAYIGNFVGIPTDCPHREKNGWTGDAQLAAETGLWNYDATTAYLDWLDTLADTQRTNGQLPGIAPSSGWGYNWGSGPAWDSALILIPWYLYLYTGDRRAIEQHFDAMVRYLEYLESMATDDIVHFGLGDWCRPKDSLVTPSSLTSTAYYYVDALTVARFAALLGREDEAQRWTARADRIKTAFHHTFYAGDGVYANGSMTAIGCALYQGLVPKAEHARCVEQLLAAVRAAGTRSGFGILGHKYVLRALAENGHVDVAYRLLTQPDFPGWVHWLRAGATTLHESWGSHESQNHIMFGDISAWMFQYLAGIVPRPEYPGFAEVLIRPQMVEGLARVAAAHRAPTGEIRSTWEREGDAVRFEIALPTGTRGVIELPDGRREDLHGGTQHFESAPA